jgi:hypothetical protein
MARLISAISERVRVEMTYAHHGSYARRRPRALAGEGLASRFGIGLWHAEVEHHPAFPDPTTA